jgi:hypothetical protein
MREKDIETIAAEMQRLLDRDYAYLEWRILLSPLPRGDEAREREVHVHVRTRDFRSRGRISRSWSAVRAASSLRLLVADIVAEAEHLLDTRPAPES